MSDVVQQAAKDGNAAVLRKASRKELNRREEDGWTAVHWAAWNGNPDPLQVILDKGGDADCTDDRGFSALHVAAKYGNTGAAEVMLNREKEVNLWALDNLGRTPARVAALNQKVECCRFLDTLAIRWEMQNPDYATKKKEKAMKDLSKRAERDAKAHQKEERRDPKKRAYSHSTAPSGERGRDSDMKSSSATQLVSGRRKKQSTTADVLRQNFELRTTSSADHINETATSSGTTSDEESGVLRPAGVRTGPLLNNLKSLGHPAGSRSRAGGISQESGLGSSSDIYLPTMASTSRRSSGSGQGGGLPDAMLSSQPIVIENDSPLATFLQSLDLIDHIQLLHRERLDLEALALCEEKDLSDIGLPLGPRKKILNAVQRRQALLKKPGRMVDTEL
jgi:hypothetical protein